jgi:hypothetical protein
MTDFRNLFSIKYVYIIRILLFLIIATLVYRFFKDREGFTIQASPIIALKMMSLAQAQAQAQGQEMA